MSPRVHSLPSDASAADVRSIAGTAASGFVSVAHPETGEKNLIRAAYRNDNFRSIVTELAQQRFYLYKHVNGSSGFVRADVIPRLWHRVRAGDFLVNSEGVIYTCTPPKVDGGDPKLVVVFSSIYSDIFASSLMRYFMQNFPKVQSVLTPETAVLRIADIGGVVGGFYLPTVADPEAAAKVSRLIDEVASGLGVQAERTVLYGASKGATAAVYHGLTSGRKFVAVDPIVSDEYYETAYRDSHFTGSGVFPAPKQEVFSRLVSQNACAPLGADGDARAVIYSERSPQYDYVETILVERLRDRLLFLNSRHPEIQDHPDVARKTMAWAIMLLNMSINCIPIEPGVRGVI